MDIEKILWPSDRSEESDRSLAYASFIARKYRSSILGIHVTHRDTFMSRLGVFDFDRKPLGDAFEQTEKDFEEYFDSIRARLAKRGIRFRGKILRGEPGARILSTARREKADLIVMGTRGHGLLDRMLIGSTTLEVLRKSGIPILAFKKNEKRRAVIRHILVPVDLNEREDSALDYAMELAGRLGARITVIYVIRMVGAVYAMPTVLKSILVGSSREIVKRVEEAKLRHESEKHGTHVSKIIAKVIHGLNPAVAISDYASAKNVDLIVINKHSRKGLKKQLLGSVAEKVIQISHCSVLAIRP